MPISVLSTIDRRTDLKLGSGFSLAGALFATAVVAVFLASIRLGLMADSTLATSRLIAVAALGLIVGAMLGVIAGLRQIGGWRGAIAGMVAGTLFGPPGALLLVLPAAIPGVVVGSVLLVALAALMRRLSSPQE